MMCCVRSQRGVNPLLMLLRTCVSVVICACVSEGYTQQSFAIEPLDQIAIMGSRVMLPCRVLNRIGPVQWTKNGIGLGTDRDLMDYKRYKMIGSDEEGDYTLDIPVVLLKDDALYQCQVGPGRDRERPLMSRKARLTVIAPPDPPKILQGSFYSTTKDSKIRLVCESVGGKPPAEITWVDSSAGVVKNGVTYEVEPLPGSLTFKARSTLHIIPKEGHNNQTFTCQAQNQADRMYQAASIRIEVKYAPRVKIQIKTDTNGKIVEGHNVIIVCKADANPLNLTYEWYMNDELIVKNISKLTFNGISRKYHDAIVKCVVYNDIGKTEETETLEITYAPSFRNRPEDVKAETGTSVTLSCDVDGYPNPEIQWLHCEEDQNIRVGTTANLTLTVDTHTSGRYLCRASVDGYQEIEAEALVYIKGPPKIISKKTQFGIQGETVTIECAVFSVEKMDSIVWLFKDEEIHSAHDHDYTFMEHILPGELVINYTLIIRESQPRHFGEYTCTVTNAYGSDTMEIVLSSNKSFPLLLILFGVTSGTIMVAAVIMLVILCQRKQRKNQQSQVTEKPDVTVTAEELFKENDRNSNINDLKLKLREANGSREVNYSNTGSDSTLCSNAKLGSGIPLAGSVQMSAINQSGYQAYRNSNVYTDPTYTDFYKVNGFENGHQTYVHYGHDYTPGSLRIESPNSSDKLTPNRSINGSLPRSVDTPSTVQSRSNSLQRKRGSSNALNSLALPTTEALSRVPNSLIHVDVRYAATYGNPHLRTGRGFTVNTAKPSCTPAPPPYPFVRNSVIMPSGTSSHSITSPTSAASPQCATSPITTSTVSNDSETQPTTVGVATTSATPQSPGAQYILAPSNRTISNATVTKKGNGLQSPLATHV